MDSHQKNLLHYENSRKSVGVAYLFWLLAGIFGAHRFYLRDKLAWLQLGLVVGGCAVLFRSDDSSDGTLAVLCFLIVALWAIVDLFLIPKLTKDTNNALLERTVGETGAL